MIYSILYWLAAVVTMSVAQGLLLPALRLTPPGAEAKKQAFSLHYLLTAAYFLPLVLAPHAWSIAVLARLLFFDLAINLAAGRPAFEVGQTAATDKAIRWLAGKLGMEPEHLRMLLWLACLAGAALWVAIYNS